MTTPTTTIIMNSTTTTITNSPVNSNNTVVTVKLMLFFLVLFLTEILNTILMLLFITRQKMAKTHYLFVNLTVSNCIACFLVMPYKIGLLLVPPERNHYIHCKYFEALSEVWWISQNLTILFMSYDRYKDIAKPFTHNTSTYKVLKITGIWCTTIATTSLFFTPWVNITYQPVHKSCRKDWGGSVYVSVYYTTITFWVPALVLFSSHIYMLRQCYIKKKLTVVAKQNSQKRSIYPDQYTANAARSFSFDIIRKNNGKDTYPQLSRSNSANFNRTTATPLKDVGSTWSRTSSRTSSIRENSTLRKWSYQTKSMSKSVHTTVLILGSYLLATLPKLIRICYQMTGHDVSEGLEVTIMTQFTLVFTFPYIFGPHSREINEQIRLMYHRMKCWHSGRIQPSPNIDEKDYTDNVVRLDSRRNSMTKPSDEIPVINLIRSKENCNGPTIQHIGNDNTVPIQLFMRNDMTPCQVDIRQLPPVQ